MGKVIGRLEGLECTHERCSCISASYILPDNIIPEIIQAIDLWTTNYLPKLLVMEHTPSILAS